MYRRKEESQEEVQEMPAHAPQLQELTAALPPGKVVKNATAETDQSRAVAEVQSMMVVAKRFPRNEIEARDKILNACMRKGLAATAQYTFARGGTDINGPSIRLAEVMAAAWGNITAGWRELSRENGVSEIEAFAWDLESNTRWPMVFQVKHVRDTKSGSKALRDERDIYEVCANQASRRVRACILKLIPGDITDDAIAQCDETLKKTTDVRPEQIKRMVDALMNEFKVTQPMIEARIQRRLDSITPPQVIAIGKVYNSLKDGMSAPGDWFDMSLAALEVAKPAAPAKEAEKPAPAAKVEASKEEESSVHESEPTEKPQPKKIIKKVSFTE